ncbi:MAG: GldG family protein [Oscillospiraceae bacterium]|nr:GldG family protein [Oscillospiraceae bacterium]
MTDDKANMVPDQADVKASDPKQDVEQAVNEQDSTAKRPEEPDVQPQADAPKAKPPIGSKKTKPVSAKKAAREKKRASKALVDRRNRRMGRFSTLSILLIIAVLLVVNILLESVVGDAWSWDITSNKLMTLGDVSTQLLDGLEQDVSITYLGTEDTLASSSTYSFMPDFLKEYVEKSNGKVTVTYVDPVAEPSIYTDLDANDVYNLTSGEFVVKSSETGRIKVVTTSELVTQELDTSTYTYQITGYSAESAISGAINYVTLSTVPKIYFTSGHSEATLSDSYQYFENLLQNNGFETADLDLITTDSVPEDASAVIMLAPQTDLTELEAGKLTDYVEQGGNFMFAAGDFSTTAFTNVNKVLEDFNLSVSNDRAIETDQSRIYSQNNTYIIATSPSSDITASTYADNSPILILDAHYIQQLQNPVDWITVTNLIETSDQGARQQNGDEDSVSASGVQTVALMSENTGFENGTTVTTSSRAIALGSASLFSDEVISVVQNSWYNYQLTYNMINWLTNNDASGSDLLISDKDVASYYLTNATNTAPLQIIAFFCSVVIPLILIIAAIVVYRRRQHL